MTAYGSSDAFAGEKINLEFVSANPTGPLHIGAVRWAAVGDALGRVFTFSGAEVTREYYFNDHGAQLDRFSSSLLAWAKGRPVPEDGYGGAYIEEIAKDVVAKRPEVLDLPEDEAQEVFRAEGVELMFAEIKQSLHDFGVDFDVYFHENNLHESGAVERAIERLTEMGNTYTEDGALWLRTEKYGDDKDRVIVRSNGTPAYISGDLAYYLDKKERGFDRCFIMLGADHHGYVGRMNAMCAAFGDEPGKDLEILIGQMVNLLREGKPLRMSKRAGTTVTINDLVDAIGVDASRYALARYTNDTNIDLDLDLWARAHNDNPVYYVQYAHARTCRMIENAADLGMSLPGEGSTRRCSPTSWTARCSARWRSSRGSSRPPPSSAPRTGSRATSRTRPRSSTGGTTPRSAGCCRSATSPSPRPTRRASCSCTRSGRCSPTGWRSSASPLPRGCDRACRPPTPPAGRTPTVPCARTGRAGRTGSVSRPTPTRSSSTSGRARPPRPTAS